MKRLRIYIYLLFITAAVLAYGCGSNKTVATKKAQQPARELEYEDETAQYYVDSLYLASLAKEHVIAGATFEQQGKYAEAAIEYQQAAKYVRSPDVYFAQAKAFRLLGKPDLMRDAIDDALKLDSNYVPAIELLVWYYLQEENIKDAQTTLLKLIALEPTNDNKMALAQLYRYDNPEESIRILEEIFSKTKSPEVKDALFEMYQYRGFVAKMTEFAERLYRENPEDLNEAGRYEDILIRYREFDKAGALLDTLLAKHPDGTLAQYFDYFLRQALEDTTEESRNFLLRAAHKTENRFRDFPETRALRGYIFEINHDKSNAEKVFAELAATDDTTADFELQYAAFYQRMNDSTKADSLLKFYYPRFENDQRFLLDYAYYLVDKDRFNESQIIAKKLLTLAPDSLNFTLLYADITNKLRNYEESDSLYEEILKRDPFNPMANNNYAFALAERGEDLRKALAMSGSSLSSDPENPFYLDTYGYVLYRMGKYDEALDYLKRAAKARPDSWEVFEHLGDVYTELGESREAKDNLRKAHDLNPNDERISEKLRKIE